MKFFLLFFVSISLALSSVEYKCAYKVSDQQGSILEPVMIDLIHEGILSGLSQILGDTAYDTTRLVSVSETNNDRSYIYYISIQELNYAEEIFEKLFVRLKDQIHELEPSILKEMIKKEIQKKLSGADLNKTKSVLEGFRNMADEFFTEKKQSFIESLSLMIEKKTDGLQLNYNLILDLFYPMKLTLASSLNSSFRISASDREKKIIREIVTELGSRSLISLLAKKSDMDKLGDQIRNVPPLEFLAIIFSQKDLKDYMKTIRKSHFKWSNFVDEISSNMSREKKLGGYEDKIKDFAEYMKVDADELIQKANDKDWSGFINCLF